MDSVLVEPLLPPLDFRDYQDVTKDSLYREVYQLSDKLQGVKIVMLSATAYGGGVAELLKSTVPLLRSLGIDVRWLVLAGDLEFFRATKGFHDALQGADYNLTAAAKRKYLAQNRHIAKLLAQEPADIFEIHDPQPAAVIDSLPPQKSIWRCHIDTSTPNPTVWQFLLPYLKKYPELVFTLPEYVPNNLSGSHLNFIRPAIDILSEKNRTLPALETSRIVHNLGINTKHPLIVQASRYDRWKDPRGVVDAFKIALRVRPDIQLALVGSMATDDPDAVEIYKGLQEYVRNDPNIFLFADLADTEVNALRTQSDVIIQKSLREGFGLTVAEGMWKGKPVIGGNVGGIKTQIESGVNGFLVDSIEECAQRLLVLLNDPSLGQLLGQRGKATVKEHFSYPRLLRDQLRLYTKLLSK